MNEERTFADRAEPGEDGTVRKSHYGEGRQPIDDMYDEGWAVGFMAGSILRYLRRTKDTVHSLESARRYNSWLSALAKRGDEDAKRAIERLSDILTPDEVSRLSCE